MPLRFRLMMGATALLYLGPLLAGLGGFGWAVVPVFAGIFLLWLVILRPSHWPQSRADWRNSRLMVRALAGVAMQLLLVTLCFAIGSGIGGVTGALPGFPVMLPIAVSFLAIPISRLLWSTARPTEAEALLDAALHQLHASPLETEAMCALERARADALTAPLFTLASDTPDATLLTHLETMSAQLDPASLLDAVARRLGAEPAPNTVARRALILHATSPVVALTSFNRAEPCRAFALSDSDPALVVLFCSRAAALLLQLPEAWGDCPSTALLREDAAVCADPAARKALTLLADLQDRVAPPQSGQSVAA